MQVNIIVNYLSKTLFVVASMAILVAFLELAAQLIGESLVFEMYSPGRLIELSAMLLIFVIAVELRQIREELRTTEE